MATKSDDNGTVDPVKALEAANKTIEDLQKKLADLARERLASALAVTADPAKPAPLKKLKKGLYHTNYAQSIDVHVVAENDDGTVDLTRDGKTVCVKSCPVSDKAVNGHCSIGTKVPKAEEPEEEGFEDLGQ